MDIGIRNKLALVTGAGQGIGRAIAIALAAEGARLILVGRTAAKLEAVRSGLAGGKRRHFVVGVDLMSNGAVTRLCRKIKKDCGEPDIIVHNIGGSLGVTDPLASSLDWQKVWQFNLGISIELNRAFIPGMVKKRWGRIVHLSALAATTVRGYAAYSCAKAAVNAYVKAVGVAVAKDNVVISAVSPGAIHTEGRYFAKLEKENPAALAEYFKHHLPTERLGKAEEIGPVVAFFCSDLASFATGSIVAVDGGGL